MEAWWADLEKDETAATRALLNLADRRDETVAFLKAKMKPLKISAGEVRALLLKLGNEDEKVWQPASRSWNTSTPGWRSTWRR